MTNGLVARGWRSLALAVWVGSACPGGLRQAGPFALLPGLSSLGLHDTCPLVEAGGVLPACLQQRNRCDALRQDGIPVLLAGMDALEDVLPTGATAGDGVRLRLVLAAAVGMAPPACQDRQASLGVPPTLVGVGVRRLRTPARRTDRPARKATGLSTEGTQYPRARPPCGSATVSPPPCRIEKKGTSRGCDSAR